MKDLSEVIEAYTEGTAIIRYRQNGDAHDWAVSVGGPDNEATLRKHLAYWRPDAEFVGCIIKPWRRP